MDPDGYAEPGALTQLTDEQLELVRQLDGAPEPLCRTVQGLVVFPGDAYGARLSEERMVERNLRPARALLDRILMLGPHLSPARPVELRLIGTCRHFAVLSCAFLRAQGVPARARCGFATYFVEGKYVDHWITEYWSEPDTRWVRIDSEVIGLDVVASSQDLPPGTFLTGGEAWQQYREHGVDGQLFGVDGTENWGPAEIRGNAIRDIAALNKVEMLPWDEWGPMAASYRGDTDAAFDDEMDALAQACASEDEASIRTTYEQFRVPDELVV